MLTGRLSPYSKRLKAHMSVISFTGSDPIAILAFLESCKTSCNHNHVNEVLTMQILPYGLEGQPKLTLINYLRQPGITYQKTINFLLTKYARNETILQTVDTINTCPNSPTSVSPMSQTTHNPERTAADAPINRCIRQKYSSVVSRHLLLNECNAVDLRTQTSASTT